MAAGGMTTANAAHHATMLHTSRPGRLRDRTQMRTSLDRLAALQARGARIFFGHDIDFWKMLPPAGVAIT